MFVTMHIGQGLNTRKAKENRKLGRQEWKGHTPFTVMHTQLAFTCSYSFQATPFKCTLIVLLTRAVLKEWREARQLLKLRCIIKSNIYHKRLSTVSFRQLHYFIIYALHNKNSGTNQCVLVTHSPPFNANIT